MAVAITVGAYVIPTLAMGVQEVELEDNAAVNLSAEEMETAKRKY